MEGDGGGDKFEEKSFEMRLRQRRLWMRLDACNATLVGDGGGEDSWRT